jgi:hypothetical protein
MEIVRRARSRMVRHGGTNRDATIMLGYVVFAIVIMILVYLDALSPGVEAGDVATMAVLP